MAGLLLLALAGAWNLIQSGGLIKSLGGATRQDLGNVKQIVTSIANQKLSCDMLTAEEHQPYRQCTSPQYEVSR